MRRLSGVDADLLYGETPRTHLHVGALVILDPSECSWPFGVDAWKRLLGGLSLDEIQTQLRAFEVRFDQKHPPSPVSRPETLPEESAEEGRAVAAFAIARE